MTTLQDIETQKDLAVAAVQAKIDDAMTQRASAPSQAEEGQWDNVIDKLNDQRDAIIDQAYEGEMSSPAMQAALAALKAATDNLNQVAGRMRTVTTYISNMADFLGAVDKLAGALK